MVMGYVGYYVAGYYLREYTISRLAEAIVYVLGVLGAVVTVWGTAVLSTRAGGLVDTLYGYFSPNVCAFSVAVVVLFRYVLGVSEERSRRKVLSGAGAYAFGIYLIYPLWALVFQWFGVSLLAPSPVVAVPLFALVFFLLSLPLAWLVSLIPGVGPKLT